MADPTVDPKFVPPEIDRWNWGAFLLNWIWGVGNNTFIALLTFIPFFGLIMPFVLGAKGSRWAWRNGRWDSVEHFKRVQRAWAIWGLVVWLGAIALFGGIFGGTFYLLGHSAAYELATSRIQSSTEAVAALGAPISTGFPLGKVSTTGDSGQAVLEFSATGTKATGSVSLQAIKKDGTWSLTKLTLKVNGSDGVIDLLRESRVEIRSRLRVAAAIGLDERAPRAAGRYSLLASTLMPRIFQALPSWTNRSRYFT